MKRNKDKFFNSKFRSGLENEISDFLSKRKVPFEYEKERIPYTVPSTLHTYTPDFTITTETGKKIYIEAKGIWAYKDRYKHLLVRQQHPQLDIRFVFSNPNSKISKKSKVTYKDICEGRGRSPFKDINWKWSRRVIPQEWLEE